MFVDLFKYDFLRPAFLKIEDIFGDLGINLALVGMMIVFLGLILLTLILYNFEPLINKSKSIIRDILESGKKEEEREEKPAQRMTGEEAAAVSMAIILYHRMHMTEHRERLTAQSELKKLSPWSLSGKIHYKGGPFLG